VGDRSDEAELVAAIADGDKGALGKLYDRYAPLLVGLGLRILRERRETEDVLHDVFLEVWQKAADYDIRRGSVRAWLFLRMRSRCADRRKSAGYSRVESLDEGIDSGKVSEPEAPGGGGEDPYLAPDRSTLRAAIGALPAEQRSVVELGYFEGLSSSEIADRLSVPLGTVKSRVAAALAKLRMAMAVAT
jgi:RNA polymerase sigma-70 factor (ECF subfamily)